MISKREARAAEALGGAVDMNAEVEATVIYSELRALAMRAWALRARVVDFRDIRATFVVSGRAFDLLTRHGVTIGVSPAGNEFERYSGEGASYGLLFGTATVADLPDSRHSNVSLILDGEDIEIERAEDVDPDEVLGVESTERPVKIRGVEGLIES